MQNKEKALQELLELIEIGNSLPPDEVLPTVESLYKQIIKEKTGKEASECNSDQDGLAIEAIEAECHDEFWLKLIHQLRDYPRFIELLNLEIPGKLHHPSDYSSIYVNLVHKAKYIKWIAQYTDNWQKRDEPKEWVLGATPSDPWLKGKEMEDYISNNKIIIRDGKLDFDFDPLAKIIKGKDPERIRICRNCGNIFWAFRLDSHGCSTKCNQNLRIRKYREKEEKRFQPRRREDDTL